MACRMNRTSVSYYIGTSQQVFWQVFFAENTEKNRISIGRSWCKGLLGANWLVFPFVKS